MQSKKIIDTKRVALYMRVSTAEQVKEGYGLDSQKRILRAFVESNEDQGWITSDNLMYIDEGISGVTEVHERPALSRLKSDILDKKIDILLVWKIDRLFRKTSYLLEFIEFLKSKNINFVSKNEHIDLSSPTGKLVLTLLGAISEMEREVITERTHEGKLSKALQGYFVYGRNAPYGYMLENDGHGNKLVLNPETAPVVMEIFDMYVKEKKTSGEIARVLTARGIGTDKDKLGYKIHKGLFRQSEIGDIIRNETYIGNYYCNRRLSKKENGKQITTLKDPSEWVLIQVTPIISDEIWKEGQELLQKAQIYNGKGETHIFTGLVKCALCGRSYVYYKTQKGKGNYRCIGRSTSKVSRENLCINGGISEEKLMKYVFPKIELLLQNPDDFIRAYEYQENDAKNDSQKERFQKELIDIEDLLRKKESTKKDAMRKSIENPDDSELYLEIIADISKEVKILIDRKKNISTELAGYAQNEKTKNAIKETALRLKDELFELTELDKTELMRKLVDVVMVGKTEIEVRYRFQE